MRSKTAKAVLICPHSYSDGCAKYIQICKIIKLDICKHEHLQFVQTCAKAIASQQRRSELLRIYRTNSRKCSVELTGQKRRAAVPRAAVHVCAPDVSTMCALLSEPCTFRSARIVGKDFSTSVAFIFSSFSSRSKRFISFFAPGRLPWNTHDICWKASFGVITRPNSSRVSKRISPSFVAISNGLRSDSFARWLS